MNITELENELFERWKQKYGGKFMSDGVPCPEDFEKENIKITFVLKEANEPIGNWDMRDWINECGADKQGGTWNNIARWTQAILEGGDYQQNISTANRRRLLKRISFLNLKKVGGSEKSKPHEIRRYAQDDAALILEQLTIYRPDIIVGGGINLVANCLGDDVFHYEGGWDCYLEYKSCRCFYAQIPGKAGKTAVLNCYHPQNRGSGYTAKDLFNAIASVSPKLLEGR